MKVNNRQLVVGRRSLLLGMATGGAAVIAGGTAFASKENKPPARPYDGKLFDVQAHAVKPSMLGAIAGSIRSLPFITDATKDIIVNDILAAAADDLDSTRRRQAIGAEGVQVVTVNIGYPDIPPPALLGIVKELNEWMAQRTDGQRGLIGTATMPPPPALAAAGTAPDGERWADKGLALMRTAVTDLGLRGMMISSNYGNTMLGHPSFQPFFALAAELHVPLIIHPAVKSVDAEFVPRRNVPTEVGYLNDQRTTVLDLIKAGTLEMYPDLQIVATHLGGGILGAVGRLEQLTDRFPAENTYVDRQGATRPLPLPVSEYLKRMYFDTNNATQADIVHAASVVGDGHLVAGTDFPWTDDTFTRRVLGELDKRVCQKIAWDNAKSLFG